jgi:tetratricopeptide (TPR) repeat protein
MRARSAALVVLLAAPFAWIAPAAAAAVPTPPIELVTDARSGDAVAAQSRLDELQTALGLSMHAQEAVDRADYYEAQALFQQALTIFERTLGPEDLRIVGLLSNLANASRARGDLGRAELLYRRLTYLMEQAFGPSHVLVGEALASEAEVVAGQEHYGQAKGLYERALSIYEAKLGTDDPLAVRLRGEYASLLVKLNQRDAPETERALDRESRSNFIEVIGMRSEGHE